MQESLLSQGIDLMVYGMGTVYVFLIILIIVTSIISKVLNRFFPTPVASPKPAKAQIEAVEPQVLSAIQAAIAQHRAKRR